MINVCKGRNYESRLHITGLQSLEEKRTRGDLIQVFKLIKNVDKLEYGKFFRLVTNSRTRGHNYKLAKTRCRLEIRKTLSRELRINKTVFLNLQ